MHQQERWALALLAFTLGAALRRWWPQRRVRSGRRWALLASAVALYLPVLWLLVPHDVVTNLFEPTFVSGLVLASFCAGQYFQTGTRTVAMLVLAPAVAANLMWLDYRSAPGAHSTHLWLEDQIWYTTFSCLWAIAAGIHTSRYTKIRRWCELLLLLGCLPSLCVAHDSWIRIGTLQRLPSEPREMECVGSAKGTVIVNLGVPWSETPEKSYTLVIGAEDTGEDALKLKHLLESETSLVYLGWYTSEVENFFTRPPIHYITGYCVLFDQPVSIVELRNNRKAKLANFAQAKKKIR